MSTHDEPRAELIMSAAMDGTERAAGTMLAALQVLADCVAGPKDALIVLRREGSRVTVAGWLDEHDDMGCDGCPSYRIVGRG